MEDEIAFSDPIDYLLTLELQENELAFIYFGWAGILLKAKKKIIAFDIGQKCLTKKQLTRIDKLDIQLYSHTHWDHYDVNITLQLYEQTGAKVIAEKQVYESLSQKVFGENLFEANPDIALDVNDFKIETVIGVHPRPISLFRLKWNDFSIFHGADSGYVPLKKLSADIAIIPTGTPSPSCSPENGLKMTLDVKPSIVIATHGTTKQREKYKSLVEGELPNTRVIIPEEEKFVKLLI